MPQGSVVGPLLFILCADELASIFESANLLYAGDVGIRREINGGVDACVFNSDSGFIIPISGSSLVIF